MMRLELISNNDKVLDAIEGLRRKHGEDQELKAARLEQQKARRARSRIWDGIQNWGRAYEERYGAKG